MTSGGAGFLAACVHGKPLVKPR